MGWKRMFFQHFYAKKKNTTTKRVCQHDCDIKCNRKKLLKKINRMFFSAFWKTSSTPLEYSFIEHVLCTYVCTSFFYKQSALVCLGKRRLLLMDAGFPMWYKRILFYFTKSCAIASIYIFCDFFFFWVVVVIHCDCF